MTLLRKRPFVIAAFSLAALLASTYVRTAAPAKAEEAKADPKAFYEKDVLPILRANCLACHGGEKKIKGGLNLTTRKDLLTGGDSGAAFNAEKPLESLLLQAVKYEGDTQMPPKGKLSQKQIDTLTEWVKLKVPYSDNADAAAVSHGPPKVDAKAKAFWAFKPVQPVPVPAVKKPDWAKNPVDSFILSKLEVKQFEPAVPADPTALLKRVHYALTGLPPTSADVDAFQRDHSPAAYEEVVDRLLASRHYGEHWARHWMDLARYAETNSFERDGPKQFAWKYRDYLIRSFNANKPYDQFIREQLAGDELETVTRDSLIATGFLRLGIWDDEPADRELAYYEQMDDMVSTTGQTFLGLTVGCARCHDHKIDPFPQKDYYGLLAFFHGVNGYGNGAEGVRLFKEGKVLAPPAPPKEGDKKAKKPVGEPSEFERKMADVKAKIAAIELELAVKLVAGEKDDFQHEANRTNIVAKQAGKLIDSDEAKAYAELVKKRDELNANRPDGELVMAVVEQGRDARPTHLLIRGMPAAPGEIVEPGFPSVLTDAKPKLTTMPPEAKTSGRRRALADWIADSKNPITARVMANRLFQFTFGRGIVRSSNNFGYQGTPPTHPELLDWLANELVRQGWKLKPVLRTLVLSNAFQMTSDANPAYADKDPENDLLSHFDMRRLSAEEIRDSLLAICGTLNLAKSEGPSVYPFLPKEVLAGQSQPGSGWGKSSERDAASRSVYVYVKRSLAVPLLNVFDAPDPDSPCPVRFTTTQPSQALGMINSAFLNEQAGKLADLIKKDAGTGMPDRVKAAFRRALLREPTAKEIARGMKLIEESIREDKLDADEAFRRFCLVVLNLNEVVFLN